KMSVLNKFHANKTWGGIFLVAGTTIGGGMLGLPLTGMGIGLGGSFLLMLALWTVMYCAAVVTLDVNNAHGSPMNLASLARKQYGLAGSVCVACVLYGLFYALLAAYIAASTSITLRMVPSGWVAYEQSSWALSLLITTVLGGVIGSHLHYLDAVNRVCFIVKTAIFVALVTLLIPVCQKPVLLWTTWDLSAWIIAVPAFFTSFGFHGSIPAVMAYVPKAHHKATFAWGSLTALAFYVLWLGATLLPLGADAPHILKNTGGDVGLFLQTLARTVNVAHFEGLTMSFALLAIITSFLGVGIGLMGMVEEQFSKLPKAAHIVITFGPPLGFALFYPQGFLCALTYAAIALALLAIIIPCLLSLQLQYKPIQAPFSIKRPYVWLLLFIGLGLIAIECSHLLRSA
ncbi:MAG TPA: aromatic amino acid transport family protein, partial [Opitutales bacterium]|nr:aromatic amino acid transport family protein [Opitutales bacterium]